MHGTGHPILRRAVAGAIVLLAFVGLVFVVARSVQDEAAVPPPQPAVNPAPVRQPRIRVEQPAAPTEPPPRSIRVAVTSMDGKPIAGARVQLVRGPPGESRWSERQGLMPRVDAPRIDRTAAADADGTATFVDVEPGRWFVVGEAPEYARHVLVGVTREADDAVEAPVVLEKGTPFAGTILDPDGEPAAGVAVVLWPRSVWPSEVGALRTRTDKDGAYRFDALEPGQYVFWYEPHRGLLVQTERVLVPSLDGLDVRMVRGATIEGVVRDADTDAPLPGARVFAMRFVAPLTSASDGETSLVDVGITDRTGNFALHTWRTRCELIYLLVDATGYAPTPIDDSGIGPPGAVAQGQRFAFDLRVRRAASVMGTLSGRDGPLAGFWVRVTPQDNGASAVPESDGWVCAAGSDGRFRVSQLPTGPADISAFSDVTVGPAAEAVLDLVAGDNVRDLRVEVERVRVTHRIVDDKGEAVEGVKVVERFGEFRAEARTDAEGRFTMDAVFAGTAMFVELRSARIRQTAIMNRDQEGGTLFPPLPSRIEVAGKLIRQDESPVPAVRVRLVGGMQMQHGYDVRWTGVSESVSASDGTFRMAMRSGPDGFVQALLGVQVEQEWNDEPGPGLIRVPDVVHVTGLAVVAGDGDPMSGALVRDENDVVVARTAAGGRFAFDWGPQYRDALHLTCAGWSSVSIESGENKLVAMRRSLVVAGTVRISDGTPARGLKVAVRAAGVADDTETQWTSTSATDSDGRFRVPEVDAGPCVVTVADPADFAWATSRKETVAGDTGVAMFVRPGARLEVEVADSDGDPVRGARVVARPTNAELETVEGRPAYRSVEFGLVAGESYTVRVEHEGFEPVERAGVRAGGEPLRIVLTSKP